MAALTIKNLTFSYPMREKAALDNINLRFEQGEFVLVCGSSGSGKTTLLRHLKAALMPVGTRSGGVYYSEYGEEDGFRIEDADKRAMAEKIGYVLQNPDNQIVTDKVWHELAFGLENLGFDNNTIRLRVSEMASFFGIQGWFEKNVSELSGGQKQLLNLAAIMVMQPDILVLDEPTSRLDPIAADDFVSAVRKINRELGITVIMSEQRLENVFADADRVIVMDAGKVVSDTTPANIGAVIGKALPAPVRIYQMLLSHDIGAGYTCPLDVRDGRVWLNKIIRTLPFSNGCIANPQGRSTGETSRVCEKRHTAIKAKNVWFRYEKQGQDILKGLSLDIEEGEIFAILGGNGAGKTTALKVISGKKKPYRGSVNISGGRISMLEQEPQLMFSENTVSAELYIAALNHIKSSKGIELSDSEMISVAWDNVKRIAGELSLTQLLDSHPYDLSGGEQQRAALAAVLLTEPDILLLDEPTKGLDAELKDELGAIFLKLKKQGKTIIIVTHDIDFCAETADRCALLFNGSITACGEPHGFFAGNSFYTTSANRMARHRYPNAITAEEVASHVLEEFGKSPHKTDGVCNAADDAANDAVNGASSEYKNISMNSGSCGGDKADAKAKANMEAADGSFGRGKCGTALITAVMCIAAVLSPVLALTGMMLLDDRKYYAISMMIIVLSLVPFVFIFEMKKPRARELVTVSVLSALCVVGRTAFFMVPSFKPTVALVMISGICLGPQTGFLVGTVSGFVSNFFFGQGPWTPWQMLAYAFVGFAAGFSAKIVDWGRHRIWLAIFGAFSAFFIYGAIVDIWTVFGFYPEPSLKTVLSVYGLALPFNAIHAASTSIFLLLLGKPMIEKLERVKVKYGLISG